VSHSQVPTAAKMTPIMSQVRAAGSDRLPVRVMRLSAAATKMAASAGKMYLAAKLSSQDVSAHLGQQALLAPGRRARVEERGPGPRYA
jgi:hypothetical protein